MAIDTSAWTDLVLHEQIAEGNRNEVWRGSIHGRSLSVRRSRRNPASLEWELDLIDHLSSTGFRVPTVVCATDGLRHVDGIVVQEWLEGRTPSSDSDWHLVAATLERLHAATAGHAQRPDCCSVALLTRSSTSVDADMRELPDDVADDVLGVFAEAAHLHVSVIHGDPMAGNIRIDDTKRVGLLDFDESRVDVAWHDLSNLGVQVLDAADHERATRLSDAWETANAWVAEPEYALTRLAALRQSLSRRSSGHQR